MKLVVGLGNPGPKYAFNRHNAGLILVDALAQHYSFKVHKNLRTGILKEGVIDQIQTLLFKPSSFMNVSGTAVAEVVRFYKIAPEDLLVIHDEMAFPLGSVRIKKGGSHGGHNGLRNINEILGADYWRLRIGIGHPGHKEAVTGYVLGNFSQDEYSVLETLKTNLVAYFPLLLRKEINLFLHSIKNEKG